MRCLSYSHTQKFAELGNAYKKITEEPLRILFCGSDKFSIASLEKLYSCHQSDNQFIESIDVVCRPGKPFGRGLKTIREVPIAETARKLSLPLHRIDTFTNWKAPEFQKLPINLVIAVSFGLLIPPRILAAADFGGLNVHPSLLPDFHGPAPLHHTLLSRTNLTGITIQTLHPKRFDQGQILLQTPNSELIEHGSRNVDELSEKLKNEGARMLVACLRNRLYLKTAALSSEQSTQNELDFSKAKGPRHASKITKADRFIDWTNWTGDEIITRHRVIGPLWSLLRLDKNGASSRSEGKDTPTDAISKSSERRIIWSAGFKPTLIPPRTGITFPVGQPMIIGPRDSPRYIYVRTCDDLILKIDRMKIEGGEEAEPLEAAIRARFYNPYSDNADGPLLYNEILSTLPDYHKD